MKNQQNKIGAKYHNLASYIYSIMLNLIMQCYLRLLEKKDIDAPDDIPPVYPLW